MADLGYGWDDVHARWPRLIQASLSGFGQTGPMSDRPAYDMVVQALGGVMSITGPDGGEPTRVGTSIGDITAGLFGVIGILAALHDRAGTGQGALVDVAMLDCQVAILENAIARYVATGVVPGPIGARHPSITPFGSFRAADGHVVAGRRQQRPLRPVCARCSACPSWPPTSGSPPTTPAATTSPRCGRTGGGAGQWDGRRVARREWRPPTSRGADQRRRGRAGPPAGAGPQHGRAGRRPRHARLHRGRQPREALHASRSHRSTRGAGARRRPRRACWPSSASPPTSKEL